MSVQKVARVFLLTAVFLVPAAGRSFSGQYPYWYGFPDPPLHSHNPHLFWSYGNNRPLIDQRTAKRFHDRTGLRLRPSGMVFIYDMDGPPTSDPLPFP